MTFVASWPVGDDSTLTSHSLPGDLGESGGEVKTIALPVDT